jgi:hypothetical protein
VSLLAKRSQNVTKEKRRPAEGSEASSEVHRYICRQLADSAADAGADDASELNDPVIVSKASRVLSGSPRPNTSWNGWS